MENSKTGLRQFFLHYKTVLRIRDVYQNIPDLNFSIPDLNFRIPDPGEKGIGSRIRISNKD
jgi:hypothetical protein